MHRFLVLYTISSGLSLHLSIYIWGKARVLVYTTAVTKQWRLSYTSDMRKPADPIVGIET
jgi:hypothetical protein